MVHVGDIVRCQVECSTVELLTRPGVTQCTCERSAPSRTYRHDLGLLKSMLNSGFGQLARVHSSGFIRTLACTQKKSNSTLDDMNYCQHFFTCITSCTSCKLSCTSCILWDCCQGNNSDCVTGTVGEDSDRPGEQAAAGKHSSSEAAPARWDGAQQNQWHQPTRQQRGSAVFQLYLFAQCLSGVVHGSVARIVQCAVKLLMPCSRAETAASSIKSCCDLYSYSFAMEHCFCSILIIKTVVLLVFLCVDVHSLLSVSSEAWNHLEVDHFSNRPANSS